MCFQKRLIGCDSDNLIEAICLLRKLSKLYLPQVDSIDSQVHKLLPKLEKIAIKLGYTNLEVEENVNELLQIVLKAKEKSNVIPDVLKRMALLENISKKSNNKVNNSLIPPSPKFSRLLIKHETKT